MITRTRIVFYKYKKVPNFFERLYHGLSRKDKYIWEDGWIVVEAKYIEEYETPKKFMEDWLTKAGAKFSGLQVFTCNPGTYKPKKVKRTKPTKVK